MSKTKRRNAREEACRATQKPTILTVWENADAAFFKCLITNDLLNLIND